MTGCPVQTQIALSDSHRGDLVVVQTRYGEVQHRAFEAEGYCSVGAKQVHGLDAHCAGQRHADVLWTQRVDRAQPAMVGVRVRVIEQVDGVTRRSLPGKELEQSIAVNVHDGFILSDPANGVAQTLHRYGLASEKPGESVRRLTITKNCERVRSHPRHEPSESIFCNS
jgi:hypothetical protein